MAINVYLSGAIGKFKDEPERALTWRNWCVYSLEEDNEFPVKVKCLNPMNYYDYSVYETNPNVTEKEIYRFELDRVRKSNLVLVNLDSVNESAGTIIELHEACVNHIPIIAFGDKSNLHPWIEIMTDVIFPTLDQACDYIKEYYCSNY